MLMTFIKKIVFVVLCSVLLNFAACGASSVNENLEIAKFALDDQNWDSAIAHADAALTEDPDSVKAALYLSGGYAGRGGFRLLPFAEKIADDLFHRDIYGAIMDVVAEGESLDQDDLRSAINVLLQRIRTEPARHHPNFIDFNFQVGLLMAIEAYALPALSVVSPCEGCAVDVSGITQEIKDIVQDDFEQYDNRMEAAGLLADDDLLQNLRVVHCVLKNASSAADGFDLEVLRDLVKCQHSPNDGADLTEADFESANITRCTDFDYDVCESSGDT